MASRRLGLPVSLLVIALVSACGRAAPPEEVALAYGRAVYSNDADAIWRVLSAEDKRAKDLPTLRRQQRDMQGFTGEVVRQLASYIMATPARSSTRDGRASITLTFHVPDANAPSIRTLVHEWDENRLNALDDGERQRIRDRLEDLHRGGRLPILDGDETFELVREASSWRVFLNWAGGIRTRFAATVEPSAPIEVAVTPAEVVLSPGERIRVSVRARNRGAREITLRVGHRIEPHAQAGHLALLLCPLLLPITLAPGEARDFASEYLLLADLPREVKRFDVTYHLASPDQR